MLFILFCLVTAVQSQVWTTYEKCENFGKTQFICDPNKELTQEETEILRNELIKFQKDTPCLCANATDCYNEDLKFQLGFKAALLLVPSLPNNAQSQAEIVYEHSNLGGKTCGNGILVLVSKQEGKLFTYRSDASTVLLTDEEIDKINKVNELHFKNDTHESLKSLVKSYFFELTKADTDHDAWYAMVIAGIFAVLLLVATLGMLCAIFCDFCLKNKKDKYEIPQSTSKEPIYVISEQSESIYARPHSGFGPQNGLGPQITQNGTEPIVDEPPFLDPHRPIESQELQEIIGFDED